MSPTPGRSTLITSAPNHASSCVHVGPDWTWVKSRILTPSNAFIAGSLFLGQSAFGVQVADVAAFAAGGGIDRRVDKRGLARLHRRLNCALQFIGRGHMHADA